MGHSVERAKIIILKHLKSEGALATGEGVGAGKAGEAEEAPDWGTA